MNKQETKEYYKKYYKKHKDKINLRNMKYYHTKMDLHFEGKSCIVCGSDSNLVFHHRDPKTKLGNPSHMKNGLLAVELKKCDIMCKACHTFYHRKKILNPNAYKMNLEYMQELHANGLLW